MLPINLTYTPWVVCWCVNHILGGSDPLNSDWDARGMAGSAKLMRVFLGVSIQFFLHFIVLREFTPCWTFSIYSEKD